MFSAKDRGYSEPAYKEEPVVISLDSVSIAKPGPGCSELTTSLVNV